MATILSKKKSTYGSPYAYYTVEATVSERTPTSVKVKMKVTAKLQYSASYLGTGKGLRAGFYVGESWHDVLLKGTGSTWSGTGAHTASVSFTVPVSASTTALTGIKFRCIRTDSTGSACELKSTNCSNISITDIVSKYSLLEISAGEPTQKQVEAILSGMPSAVGFDATIKWYRGSTLVESVAVPSTSKTTSYAYMFTGLLPNTSYVLKAEVDYSGSPLTSKAATITTPQETGELVLAPRATYIEASVLGMFDGPNYTRSVEFYYKKDEESDYRWFATVDSQTDTAVKNITGLISNSVYNIQVLIKNGATVLKTLTASAETLEDTSLIPWAMIEQITQQLGTRLCTISWLTDKLVAGTIYTVEAMSEGDSEWTELVGMNEFISPITVVAPAGNTFVTFRIKAVNESVAEGIGTYSGEVTFYVRDDFLWDVDKIAGQPMIITANEWNRLRDYALAKTEALGYKVNIPIVRTGDDITAKIYNTMKNAIVLGIFSEPVMMLGVGKLGVASILSNTGYVVDKRRGDVITAEDIDLLRSLINTRR